MLIIRTLSLSPPPCSNQLRRLLLAASRFPGGRGSRLLQFQRMDSFGSSANTHVLLPHGSSGSGDEKLSDNKDHYSDVIMIGKIPVYLNSKGNQQKSLSRSYVNECDDLESGRDKKGIPANIPSSCYVDEFPLVSRHYAKRSRRGFENNTSLFPVESLELLSNNNQQDESSLPNQFGKKNNPFNFEKRRSVDIGSKSSLATADSPPFQPFDICSSVRRGNANHEAYKWRVKAIEHFAEAKDYRVLRPGMVLLKHYISLSDQVHIVKTCQELGLGPGGFYQPGYKNGAKLRLQMMCLGLDWDPQTRRYENKRSVYDNKTPEIPTEFANLVKEALEDAHDSIKNKSNTNNIEDILPTMSPDICIVNFYTTSGRLGLHQDRDESEESLVRGLPVVSFSIGDSAEFLYGDRRDVDKAEKIVLESGDVLIFGGESRHIFHGVSSIIPKSTPKFLLDHTGLRPGRLNLTFRKY